jgi:putative ABC transport system permease protein
VNLAYPYDDFSVSVEILDTQLTLDAQVLPKVATETRLFSQIQSGRLFESDSAHEVLVTDNFIEKLNLESPDSLINKMIVISAEKLSFDSALVHLFNIDRAEFRKKLRDISYDSLTYPDYLEQVIGRELNDAARRFFKGFFNAPNIVSDTFVISGVINTNMGRRIRTRHIIIPLNAADKINPRGLGGDPADLLSAVQSGNLFDAFTDNDSRTFGRVTLDINPSFSYAPIRDSVKSMGYKVFSFAEQFKEIRKFFFYFDIGLGILGLIALVTASLGIVNTMVMSIVERRKQIGVLKSLGADDNEIRLMFLVESGVIGSLGAIAGIIFGWIISRVASLIAKAYMAREGVGEFELFALPLWLVLIALAFGLVVSLLAGYYPARRAARIDPVIALRNE